MLQVRRREPACAPSASGFVGLAAKRILHSSSLGLRISGMQAIEPDTFQTRRKAMNRKTNLILMTLTLTGTLLAQTVVPDGTPR